MRVAAVYDIHGNLPALEAVLAEIEEEGVDEVVVGGDVVPGPMPRESLSILLDLPLPVRFLRGNGENDLLTLHRAREPTRVPERFRDTIRWVADELSDEQIEEIATWPPTLTLEVRGLGEVLFCHATPRDDNEIFTRLTPEPALRPILEAAGAAVVACGHTHMQFDRTIGDVRVVNAGSVGMPFGEAGAWWLLLGPDVEPRHTRYDLTAATERIRATDHPSVEEIELIRPRGEAEMLELFEAAARGSGKRPGVPGSRRASPPG